MNADAVFEGGGVKGIGIVGAVCYFEEKGYTWERVAGTSAGSIIAALLAVGYNGKELKDILLNLDYTSFKDKTILQSVPFIGKGLGIFCEKGIYSGDEIENWVEKLLKAKGKQKFKDVSVNGESRLKLIASDITGKNMLVLPDDLVKYGIDSMDFEICKAIRMSCSIPFYYRPYKLYNKDKLNYIMDGGILSNFPIWLFDTKKIPRWPTLGFKIVEPQSKTSQGKNDIISLVLDMVDTVIQKDEMKYIKDSDFVRTITIPSLGIKATDFNITKEKGLKLFNIGYKNAQEFDATWNFNKYVKAFRVGEVQTRREKLMKS